MAFDSLDAFLAMGGHGPYVWSSYGVFFVLSVLLIVWSKNQRNLAIRAMLRQQARAESPDIDTPAADFSRVDSSKH